MMSKLTRADALLLAAVSLLIIQCKADEQSEQPAMRPPVMPAIQSWDVCTLLGPQREMPGLYGTDLGITVPLPAASSDSAGLAVLFGDSWAADTDICAYPVMNADDLQAVLPAARPNVLTAGPPTAAAANACSTLTFPLDDPGDPASWPRMHLFADTLDRAPEKQLDTSTLRTPVAAWTDGQHTFGAFVRDEVARCSASTDCPGQMICSKDAAYSGKRVGACQPDAALTADADPPFCVDDADCSGFSTCMDVDFGVCLAAAPFTVQRDGPSISPSWYVDDPLRAIALRLYLATALWPDRAQDYGTGFQFVTNKFVYPTVRTIAHFDPANPDDNDYSPGTETLLMWGRPRANATGGEQSLPFLLYQPLDGLLDEQGKLRWAPKFFAGYDEAGNPRWSDFEADAQPVYGTEEENLAVRGGALTWSKPEYDYVEQMSVAWLAPLQRWVMIYGGDPPAYIVADPKTGLKPEPVNLQPVPGAMYMRSATHPWGRSRRDADAHEAFSDARPILTRQTMAKYLACDDDMPNRAECSLQPAMHEPSDLLNALGTWTAELTPGDWATVTATCLAGSAALATQNSLGGDMAGHLYGANIVEEWTEDVSANVSGLAKGSRAVELYWNVSTWNPYSVVLVKTQLRGNAQRIE